MVARRLKKTPQKFRRWVDDLGIGTAGAAKLIGCNPSYVSLLQTGTRTPSLAVAAAIEGLTRRWRHGPIMAAEWVEGSGAEAA